MFLHGLWALFFIFVSANTFAFDESKLATFLGLELVSEGHPYNFLGINNLYINDSMSRQMLVVSDVPGELKETRIIKQRDFFIVEIAKSQTSYVSMAFVGISEKEINEKITTTSVWKKIWLELTPLPRAYGQDCGISGLPSLKEIEGVATYYGTSIAKSALNCISAANQGVRDSTVGVVESAAEGIKNLLKDPKAFWAEKVQRLKNVGNFISNFASRMKQLSTSISSLPAETIAMFMCEFIGSMGADALITIMTGGLGLGKLLFRLEEYITKILRLEKVFAALSKAGKIKDIPANFMKKLSSGEIPASVIESLTTFAHHNFPGLIQGAMQCAL
jgi:hypothetical protein